MSSIGQFDLENEIHVRLDDENGSPPSNSSRKSSRSQGPSLVRSVSSSSGARHHRTVPSRSPPHGSPARHHHQHQRHHGSRSSGSTLFTGSSSPPRLFRANSRGKGTPLAGAGLQRSPSVDSNPAALADGGSSRYRRRHDDANFSTTSGPSGVAPWLSSGIEHLGGTKTGAAGDASSMGHQRQRLLLGTLAGGPGNTSPRLQNEPSSLESVSNQFVRDPKKRLPESMHAVAVASAAAAAANQAAHHRKRELLRAAKNKCDVELQAFCARLSTTLDHIDRIQHSERFPATALDSDQARPSEAPAHQPPASTSVLAELFAAPGTFRGAGAPLSAPLTDKHALADRADYVAAANELVTLMRRVVDLPPERLAAGDVCRRAVDDARRLQQLWVQRRWLWHESVTKLLLSLASVARLLAHFEWYDELAEEDDDHQQKTVGRSPPLLRGNVLEDAAKSPRSVSAGIPGLLPVDEAPRSDSAPTNGEGAGRSADAIDVRLSTTESSHGTNPASNNSETLDLTPASAMQLGGTGRTGRQFARRRQTTAFAAPSMATSILVTSPGSPGHSPVRGGVGAGLQSTILVSSPSSGGTATAGAPFRSRPVGFGLAASPPMSRRRPLAMSSGDLQDPVNTNSLVVPPASPNRSTVGSTTVGARNPLGLVSPLRPSFLESRALSHLRSFTALTGAADSSSEILSHSDASADESAMGATIATSRHSPAGRLSPGTPVAGSRQTSARTPQGTRRHGMFSGDAVPPVAVPATAPAADRIRSSPSQDSVSGRTSRFGPAPPSTMAKLFAEATAAPAAVRAAVLGRRPRGNSSPPVRVVDPDGAVVSSAQLDDMMRMMTIEEGAPVGDEEAVVFVGRSGDESPPVRSPIRQLFGGGGGGGGGGSNGIGNNSSKDQALSRHAENRHAESALFSRKPVGRDVHTDHDSDDDTLSDGPDHPIRSEPLSIPSTPQAAAVPGVSAGRQPTVLRDLRSLFTESARESRVMRRRPNGRQPPATVARAQFPPPVDCVDGRVPRSGPHSSPGSPIASYQVPSASQRRSMSQPGSPVRSGEPMESSPVDQLIADVSASPYKQPRRPLAHVRESFGYFALENRPLPPFHHAHRTMLTENSGTWCRDSPGPLSPATIDTFISNTAPTPLAPSSAYFTRTRSRMNDSLVSSGPLTEQRGRRPRRSLSQPSSPTSRRSVSAHKRQPSPSVSSLEFGVSGPLQQLAEPPKTPPRTLSGSGHSSDHRSPASTSAPRSRRRSGGRRHRASGGAPSIGRLLLGDYSSPEKETADVIQQQFLPSDPQRSSNASSSNRVVAKQPDHEESVDKPLSLWKSSAVLSDLHTSIIAALDLPFPEELWEPLPRAANNAVVEPAFAAEQVVCRVCDEPVAAFHFQDHARWCAEAQRLSGENARCNQTIRNWVAELRRVGTRAVVAAAAAVAAADVSDTKNDVPSLALPQSPRLSALLQVLRRLEQLPVDGQPRTKRRLTRLADQLDKAAAPFARSIRERARNMVAEKHRLNRERMALPLRARGRRQSRQRAMGAADFELLKPINRGAFGRVFLGRKRRTGDIYAVKVLRKADVVLKNQAQAIRAERDIAAHTQNPFLVSFYYAFQTRDNLYLVMEYLPGGDLYGLLRAFGSFDEDMARIYIAETVLAVAYLHKAGVIHRDLKPDNLLLSEAGHVKLTDFGLSTYGTLESYGAPLGDENEGNGVDSNAGESSSAPAAVTVSSSSSSASSFSQLSLGMLSQQTPELPSPMSLTTPAARPLGASVRGSPAPTPIQSRPSHRRATTSSAVSSVLRVPLLSPLLEAAHAHHHHEDQSGRGQVSPNSPLKSTSDGKSARRRSRSRTSRSGNSGAGSSIRRRSRAQSLSSLVEAKTKESFSPDTASLSSSSKSSGRLSSSSNSPLSSSPSPTSGQSTKRNHHYRRKRSNLKTGSPQQTSPQQHHQQQQQMNELNVDDQKTPRIGTAADKQSSFASPSARANSRGRFNLVGTPDYLAPEVILGAGHGPAVDWWAIGILLFEFLTGCPPFNAESAPAIFAKILEGNIEWDDITEISPVARDLITKLLNPDPSQRLGARGPDDVKCHEFFDAIDDWDSLLDQTAPFVPTIDGLGDTKYFDDFRRHSFGATADLSDAIDDPAAWGVDLLGEDAIEFGLLPPGAEGLEIVAHARAMAEASGVSGQSPAPASASRLERTPEAGAGSNTDSNSTASNVDLIMDAVKEMRINSAKTGRPQIALSTSIEESPTRDDSCSTPSKDSSSDSPQGRSGQRRTTRSGGRDRNSGSGGSRGSGRRRRRTRPTFQYTISDSEDEDNEGVAVVNADLASNVMSDFQNSNTSCLENQGQSQRQVSPLASSPAVVPGRPNQQDYSATRPVAVADNPRVLSSIDESPPLQSASDREQDHGDDSPLKFGRLRKLSGSNHIEMVQKLPAAQELNALSTGVTTQSALTSKAAGPAIPLKGTVSDAAKPSLGTPCTVVSGGGASMPSAPQSTASVRSASLRRLASARALLVNTGSAAAGAGVAGKAKGSSSSGLAGAPIGGGSTWSPAAFAAFGARSVGVGEGPCRRGQLKRVRSSALISGIGGGAPGGSASGNATAPIPSASQAARMRLARTSSKPQLILSPAHPRDRRTTLDGIQAPSRDRTPVRGASRRSGITASAVPPSGSAAAAILASEGESIDSPGGHHGNRQRGDGHQHHNRHRKRLRRSDRGISGSVAASPLAADPESLPPNATLPQTDSNGRPRRRRQSNRRATGIASNQSARLGDEHSRLETPVSGERRHDDGPGSGLHPPGDFVSRSSLIRSPIDENGEIAPFEDHQFASVSNEAGKGALVVDVDADDQDEDSQSLSEYSSSVDSSCCSSPSCCRRHSRRRNSGGSSDNDVDGDHDGCCDGNGDSHYGEGPESDTNSVFSNFEFNNYQQLRALNEEIGACVPPLMLSSGLGKSGQQSRGTEDESCRASEQLASGSSRPITPQAGQQRPLSIRDLLTSGGVGDSQSPDGSPRPIGLGGVAGSRAKSGRSSLTNSRANSPRAPLLNATAESGSNGSYLGPRRRAGSVVVRRTGLNQSLKLPRLSLRGSGGSLVAGQQTDENCPPGFLSSSGSGVKLDALLTRRSSLRTSTPLLGGVSERTNPVPSNDSDAEPALLSPLANSPWIVGDQAGVNFGDEFGGQSRKRSLSL